MIGKPTLAGRLVIPLPEEELRVESVRTALSVTQAVLDLRSLLVYQHLKASTWHVL